MVFYFWFAFCLIITNTATQDNTEDHKYFPLVQDRAFINGEWVEAKSGLTFSVFNPCNGSEVASVPDMNVADVQDAIRAASAAFRMWSIKSPKVSLYLPYFIIDYLLF